MENKVFETSSMILPLRRSKIRTVAVVITNEMHDLDAMGGLNKALFCQKGTNGSNGPFETIFANVDAMNHLAMRITLTNGANEDVLRFGSNGSSKEFNLSRPFGAAYFR